MLVWAVQMTKGTHSESPKIYQWNSLWTPQISTCEPRAVEQALSIQSDDEECAEPKESEIIEASLPFGQNLRVCI